VILPLWTRCLPVITHTRLWCVSYSMSLYLYGMFGSLSLSLATVSNQFLSLSLSLSLTGFVKGVVHSLTTGARMCMCVMCSGAGVVWLHLQFLAWLPPAVVDVRVAFVCVLTGGRRRNTAAQVLREQRWWCHYSAQGDAQAQRAGTVCVCVCMCMSTRIRTNHYVTRSPLSPCSSLCW
jgi:hypothetical protein